MGSRTKRMVQIALQKKSFNTPAVVDIATVSSNDVYVMEPDRDLLDCINASEPLLENLGNTMLVGVSEERAYLDEQEHTWEDLEGPQISNLNIEQSVTFDIIIDRKEGSRDNIVGQNMHEPIVFGEVIQGKENDDVVQDVDIEEIIQGEEDDDEVQGVDIGVDVESDNARNWKSDDRIDLRNNDPKDDISVNLEGTRIVYEEGNSHAKDIEEMDNDESNSSGTENVKKRKRGDTAKWKRQLNKKLRMTGKKYLGFTRLGNTVRQNQPRGERKMGQPCESAECKRSRLRKCSDIIDNERALLFKMFWSELSWDQRKIYVANNVEKVNPKRRYTTEPTSRRSISYLYHLKINNTQYPVCKTMFLSTLGLGERSVREWVLNSTGGMHHSQEVAITTRKSVEHNRKKDIKTLDKFFDDLPKLPSHYARKNTSKMFLEQKIHSLTQLYNIYLDRIDEEPLTAKPVSRTKFASVFHEKNLSLYTKKDQCDTCALHEVGNLADELWNEHVIKKELARKEKQNDKALAEENKVIVLKMDLQAVKVSPSIQANACYFKTKLTSHNFTVYNLASKHCKCYWFTEVDTGLTASTFASLIIDYLKSHCSQDNKDVIIYSDGCTYQNRNCIMANALLDYSKNSQQTIIQKFLERGHTQMECDSVHSTIERKLKNMPIHLPSNYLTATIEARKKPFPYEAKWMDFNAFTNYSAPSLHRVNSIRPGAQKVTDVRAIKYTPQEEIFYKTDFSKTWMLLPQRIRHPKNPPEWPKLHTEPRKISSIKYGHLQHLKLLLPKDCQSFYEFLPHD